jgi:hypothetical protein
MVVLQDCTLQKKTYFETKNGPHVLVDNPAPVGRAVVHGCLDVREATVGLHEETYLGLGPPYRSPHLNVIKSGCKTSAARRGV